MNSPVITQKNAVPQITGGRYNAVAPTLSDGQGTEEQFDNEGNLLVNVAVGGGGVSPAVGITGRTAPTSAIETGFISGANLVGVSAANPLPVQVDNSSAISVSEATLDGCITSNVLAVSLPTAQITTLTPPTASAIAAAIVLNPPTTFSGVVTNAGTFAVQSAATLNTETTKVIGTVRNIGNAGAAFDAATGATVPANALQAGDRAATALPTAVADGQLVAPMTDKYGRQVVVLGTVRDLVGCASVQTTDQSSHNLLASGGTGVFTDLISLAITNETATATVVSLSDGTITYKFAIAANGGIVNQWNATLPASSSATAWTVTSSATVTLDFVVTYAKNK